MTIEQQTIIPIEVSDLVARAGQMKQEGNRLVQIGCTKIDDTFEINYSFDKDYRFTTFRITVKTDTVVPSISGSYWGAFIYENEIHDLFGLTIRDINIDFKGTLYKTSVKHPFTTYTFPEDNPCQNR
jgi:ech hydrogenase subunit D